MRRILDGGGGADVSNDHDPSLPMRTIRCTGAATPKRASTTARRSASDAWFERPLGTHLMRGESDAYSEA
jgi:hypothetical protein